jgi:death on curing protein
MIESLSVRDIEYVAFVLARQHLNFDEPIPDFNTRFPSILESCLIVPFQQFERKAFYKGLLEKAAILFYLMVKNHPFQNGNKRIAMTALFVFLHRNKKWLKVDTKELYNFAVWVAESNPKLKTETVEAVKQFLKTYLVDLDKS